MLNPPLRADLFGIRLDACRPQFPGLKDRLEGYLGRVAQMPACPGLGIANPGLIDNPGRALAAGREFHRQDVDLIFLHVTTYALLSRFPPAVLRAGGPAISSPRSKSLAVCST